MKLSKAIEQFEVWLNLGQVKRSTATMYRQCSLRLLETLGDVNMRDITVLVMQGYQAKRLKSVKPSTINRELATIKRISGLLSDWQNTPESEAIYRTISRVKLLPENNVSSEYWSLDESRKLLDACKDERLRTIVYTGLLTGLRLSNILNLRWDQIGKDTLTIQPDEMKAGEVLTIPIHPTLLTALKKYRLESGNGFGRYVFKANDGSIQSWFYKYFHQARKAAGLPEAKFHTSRHSFASHFVMNGGDIATLSELLGHADISITKKRYAHLSQEHKIEQVTKYAMEV